MKGFVLCPLGFAGWVAQERQASLHVAVGWFVSNNQCWCTLHKHGGSARLVCSNGDKDKRQTLSRVTVFLTFVSVVEILTPSLVLLMNKLLYFISHCTLTNQGVQFGNWLKVFVNQVSQSLTEFDFKWNVSSSLETLFNRDDFVHRFDATGPFQVLCRRLKSPLQWRKENNQRNIKGGSWVHKVSIE